MNIEYYSNAEELVDKWLAEAEKGKVSYDTSQSSFISSKAAAAAEEAHRRLLLPSAKEQAAEAAASGQAVGQSRGAGGALEKAMQRDRRRAIQAAVDAGSSDDEAGPGMGEESRANIASKRVPAATAPSAPKHKAKKRRKGGFQALPLLARR